QEICLVLGRCDTRFYAKDDSLRWRALPACLRRAVQEVDLVVASTPALAEVIHQETGGDRPIQVIGDPLDTALPVGGVTLQQRWHAWRLRRFLASRDIAPGRRLLWFGNHGASYADGGLQDLTRIERSLHAHHRTQAVSLTVLSNSEDAFRRHLSHWTLPTLYIPWSPAVFRQALAGHAIAIIPAQINPFTRCKTPNRLATAFYNGLAVAADRIPSYEEFEDWAVLDDWDEGLGRLMADAGERERRVQAARQRLLQHHDLGTICRAWDAALAQLLHPAPTAQSVHST
ncbi:glycosyltransferase, partial [Caldimonas sp.]|uniref:glycosyltransferase n=1 Tax=Caldimonas sp. TaxID=2838790 RepID=UPI00391C6855